MGAEDWLKILAAILQSQQSKSCNRLCLYPEVVYYVLEEYIFD